MLIPVLLTLTLQCNVRHRLDANSINTSQQLLEFLLLQLAPSVGQKSDILFHHQLILLCYDHDHPIAIINPSWISWFMDAPVAAFSCAILLLHWLDTTGTIQ